MVNQIDVVIQPVVLRFTLLDDEVVYFFAADTEAVLDRMELMMGIDPEKDMLFDSNLGFLPVSTTVLIKGGEEHPGRSREHPHRFLRTAGHWAEEIRVDARRDRSGRVHALFITTTWAAPCPYPVST